MEYWEVDFGPDDEHEFEEPVKPMKVPKKPSIDGVEFDSNEELEFYHWCKEAVAQKILTGFEYHPSPIVLAEKEQYLPDDKGLRAKPKHLFREHVYTVDFVLHTTVMLNLKPMFQNFGKVYVDIKGGFSKFGGGREFSINQKWVYQKTGIYVHKVVPEEFFKANGVPEAVRWTPKTGKLREKYRTTKRLSD